MGCHLLPLFPSFGYFITMIFFFIITEWQIWTHVSFAPQFSSVQFSRSVMSDSLQPHEPQHARPPCLSPTPGVHQTHVHQVDDAIQPSHPLLSPTPPAFSLFQNQGLFQWVGSSHEVAQSIGVSALASVLPKKSQDWSPLEWTGWISLQSKGLSRVQHHNSKASILRHSAFFTIRL